MATGNLIAALHSVMYPSSNPAPPSETGGPVPTWLFDDATDETVYFYFYMSDIYDGSGDIDVTVPWKFATFVGSQTCDIEISIARARDDVDSVESLSFATAQTSIETEASATGEFKYSTITFTNAQADSVGADDLFVIQLTRDASGGTQGSPGDVEMSIPIVRQG